MWQQRLLTAQDEVSYVKAKRILAEDFCIKTPINLCQVQKEAVGRDTHHKPPATKEEADETENCYPRQTTKRPATCVGARK